MIHEIKHTYKKHINKYTNGRSTRSCSRAIMSLNLHPSAQSLAHMPFLYVTHWFSNS